MTNRWIAVDLDGTLARSCGWRGEGTRIGSPVALMVERVKLWLRSGVEIRIFTARAGIPEQIPAIKAWCLQHIGQELPVTNVKDLGMIELWDDKAVGVIANTGVRQDGER